MFGRVLYRHFVDKKKEIDKDDLILEGSPSVKNEKYEWSPAENINDLTKSQKSEFCSSYILSKTFLIQ